MTCCIDLHFDYDPIINKETFLKPIDDNIYMEWLNTYEIVNPKFFKELHNIGVVLSPISELFCTKKNNTGVLHRDSSRHGPDTIMREHDFVKLNFMFGGAGSLMNWYKEKPDKTGTISFAPTGDPAERFIKEDVDLIHSSTINYPSLVQVGIPHDITNNLVEDRYVVCLVPILNTKRIPMDIALELFSPFIKIGVP